MKRVAVVTVFIFGLLMLVVGIVININTKDTDDIEYCYDDIKNETDSLLLVKDGNKYMYVDKYNNELSFINSNSYETLNNIEEKYGYIILTKNKYKGVVDLKGNIILDYKYVDINIISENSFLVMDNKYNMKFIDKTGKKIYTKDIVSFYMLTENTQNPVVFNYDKTRLLDKNGNIIFECSKEECIGDILINYDDNSKKIIYRIKKGKNNYIYFPDTNKKIKINTNSIFKNLYENELYFYDEVLGITKVYNFKGKEIKKYNFELLTPVINDVAVFRKEGKIGLIKSDETILIDAIYDKYEKVIYDSRYYIFIKEVNGTLQNVVVNTENKKSFNMIDKPVLNIYEKKYYLSYEDASYVVKNTNGNTYNFLGQYDWMIIEDNKKHLYLNKDVHIECDDVYVSDSSIYCKKNKCYKKYNSR